jgi:hypothetical protein
VDVTRAYVDAVDSEPQVPASLALKLPVAALLRREEVRPYERGVG